MTKRTGNFSDSRRGAVLAVAMVSLLLISAIVGHQAVRVVRELRQQRIETIRLQTEKLAEAGLSYARRKLQQDAAWKGGNWIVPAEILTTPESAQVSVRIESGRITVHAHLPTGTGPGCRITRSGT